MRITVAVLTYDVFANGRADLLWATVASLQVPGVRVVLVDNHSTDGTSAIVRRLGGHVSRDPLTTSGHGTNLCAEVAIGTDAEVCVLSDDDMVWRAGWADQLAAWWADAPDDVLLTGCHLEPVFPWNEIRGREVRGGVPGLIRASTGAASWSFRPDDWSRIGPVPEQQQGWGDVPACEQVWANGYRIAQLDLADHAGHCRSAWANPTVGHHGWDLDPARRALRGTPA